MMLLAVGGLRLVPSASAAESVADPIVYTLGQTHDDTPPWQDLGLEDLLVSANHHAMTTLAHLKAKFLIHVAVGDMSVG